MDIREYLLEGEGIDFQASPNHGGKFGVSLPDTIIIHYTAGSSAESSVRTLCNPRTKASAHLVAGRDGSITQLVPFDTVAWHAGKSAYKGRIGFNKYSIGIEIDNAGRLTKSGRGFAAWFGKIYDGDEVVEAIHRNESTAGFWHAYTEAQINSVIDVCEELIDAYQITSILGHEEIAPKRKTDPGPAFPLDKIRDRLLVRDREEEGEETVISPVNAGLVTASKLNIRGAPMPNAATIAPPLVKGTLVDIVSEKNGWYEIDVKTHGWVKKDYIKAGAS